jgi:hypothetical protein
MSLARCWAEQGERDRGAGLLAPLLAKFTQGFDSPGYREAQSLLQALQMHAARAGSLQ